jgi:CBS domain-containing protein
MRVGDLAKQQPSIDLGAIASEAFDIVLELSCDSLIVLDSERPVGILSSYDLIEKIQGGAKLKDVSVKDLFNNRVLIIDSETDAKEAAETMLDHKHWMAIVTEKERYKGVVTAGVLLKEFRTDYY